MKTASIIIPAHNEANVLPATLSRLAADSMAESLEVFVVANACNDSTAATAREFADRLPGLVVIETQTPGKPNALNLGDAAASAFPRIFLDADIVLGPGALQALVQGLQVKEPRVAAPAIRFDLEGADLWVKHYYRIFTRMPYASDGLVGLGVYGLSEAGRARFDRFPNLLADDLYIQRLFAPAERLQTPGTFTVRTPRQWWDLVKVRTRVDRGNAQLASESEPGDGFERSSGSSLKALGQTVGRRPALAGSAGVYLVTTILAKIRSKASNDTSWGRDESTRRPDPASPPPASELPWDAPRIAIDGVEFTAQTEPQVVDSVFAALKVGRGGRIVTPNVDIMQQASRNPELHDLVCKADIIVADGMPLVWASRLRKTPLPERVSGADLVWTLAERAAAEDRGIYLLGGKPGVARRAGEAFVAAYPGLRIVGYDSPDLGFEKTPESLDRVLDKLAAAKPDLVYLALGFPKQEIVAEAIAARLPQTWSLGCGGALDMAAGEVPRAAKPVQRIGGEWLHRLAQEPRRLGRRYLMDDLPYATSLLRRSSTRP